MSEITNELSDNINYTTVKFEELSEVSEELWNFKKLSQNKNLTLDILKKYPDKPWKFTLISSSKMLT